MPPNLVVIFILWGVFFITLARAVRKGGLSTRAGRRIWLMFFLSVLACNFWSETGEQVFDDYFFDLPVAVHLKYVCLIGVCHLYRELLRDVQGKPPGPPIVDYLAPTAIGLGLLSFVGYIWFTPMPQHELRLVVIGARDAVVLLFILTGFYRGTLAMSQQEKNPAMRLKQRFIVLFFSLYSMTTLGSISASILTLLRRGNPNWAASVLQPLLYPTIFLFVLMLIPYRWYAGVPDYRHLVLYARLRELEQQVFDLAQSSPDHPPLPRMILRAEQLDLAIYRTVISILDGYPMIPATVETQSLRQVLEESLADNPAYNDLIHALERCVDVRSDPNAG